ncbi:excisionase [Streptomyces sp. NPDC051098]
MGGVSRRTFYRWRELGQGPAAFKLPNGELRGFRGPRRYPTSQLIG